MDNKDLAKSERSELGMQLSEVSELIADWLVLYAANYGKEPTEETALVWRIGLLGLHPKELHKAFEECLKESKFWPSVAEIRERYDKFREKHSHYLPEPRPVWTDKERQKWYDELVKAYRTISDGKAPPRTVPPLSEEEWNERRDSQLAALRAKYPEECAQSTNSPGGSGSK